MWYNETRYDKNDAGFVDGKETADHTGEKNGEQRLRETILAVVDNQLRDNDPPLYQEGL